MCAMSKSSEKAVVRRSRSNRTPVEEAGSRLDVKREREKKVVSLMISLYCHKNMAVFGRTFTPEWAHLPCAPNVPSLIAMLASRSTGALLW